MEILKEKDEEERHSLYFKDSDKYRYLQPSLYELLGNNVVTATDVWRQSNLCLIELSQCPYEPEAEVPRLYRKFLKDARHLVLPDGQTKECDEEECKKLAAIVFGVTVSRLMARPETDKSPDKKVKGDVLPYSICKTLICNGNQYFPAIWQQLFFEEKTVMDEDYIFKNVDAVKQAKKEELLPLRGMEDEVESLLTKINTNLLPARDILGDEKFELLMAVYREIAADSEFAKLLQQDSPRKNDWGNINKKMVLNIVGLFCEIIQLKRVSSKLSNAIKIEDRCNPYIENPSPDLNGSSSNSAFTKEQYARVKEIIISKVNDYKSIK